MRRASEVAAAFHYSREGLAQRLVSALVLGREPVGWNDHGSPTERGREYLDRLDELAFGDRWPGALTFVDEYELACRPGVDAKDASADQAVLWADRVLVVEMKTEAGSHSPGQCEWYVDLALHHNPGCLVDVIYLTGPMADWSPLRCPDRTRAAHVRWDEADGIVQQLWAESPTCWEAEYAALLHPLVGTLHRPWGAAASELGAVRAASPAVDAAPPAAPRRGGTAGPVAFARDAVVEAARQVVADHRQRAVEVVAVDLEQLSSERNAIAGELSAAGVGDGHIRPWVWRRASGGVALTANGEATGYEIRMSWYATPAATK